ADRRHAVWVWPVGDETRPTDAPDPVGVVAIQAAIRRSEACPLSGGGTPMLNLQRILRDYREAGSVNSLLAVWGFVDDHAFLTKAGHVGIAYRLSGCDYECLDPQQRGDMVHHFEAA